MRPINNWAGTQRKYKLAIVCEKSGQMATSDEHSNCFVVGEGWKCPECGKIVKLGEWKTGNSDVKGWVGVRGPRWPRHYSWSAK